MADHGASLTQIKAVTGHRSDTVVQGKILLSFLHVPYDIVQDILNVRSINVKSPLPFYLCLQIKRDTLTLNQVDSQQQNGPPLKKVAANNVMNFSGAVFNGPVHFGNKNEGPTSSNDA